MRYFLVDTLGSLEERNLCILDKAPDGWGVKYSDLVFGRAVAAEVPSVSNIRMSDDRTGLKLATLIGNTKRFLILHRDAKEVLAQELAARGASAVVEFIPLVVVNHKGRPHSDAYFLVNPVGSLDCLDLRRSVIRYFENTEKILGIDRMVLDPVKLQTAPPLFRIREAPNHYVIDEPLSQRFAERGFTNIVLTELPTAGGSAA